VNLYFVIIVTFLFLSIIISLTSEMLNLSSLGKPIPSNLKDLYDSEEYEKSQNYTKSKTRLKITKDITSFSFLLAIIYFEGFATLFEISQISGNESLNALCFLGLFMVLSEVVEIPFSIYSTFMIESKFGFNKTSVKTYVLDKIKSYLLTSILGGIFFLAIVKFFNLYQDKAWIVGSGFGILLSITLLYIAPKFILPIFNKFTPLEDEELKSKLLAVAKKANFDIEDIFVIDGSRRSTKANAFFSGFGKNKRIGLYDTLVEKYSADEICAILAHEIGHHKKKHIIKSFALQFLYIVLLLWMTNQFIFEIELYRAFGINEISTYVGILLTSLLLTPMSILIDPIKTYFSRKNEYEADRFAVNIMESSESLIQGLMKLNKDNLTNLTPHPIYVALNYSHPPLDNRIKSLG